MTKTLLNKIQPDNNEEFELQLADHIEKERQKDEALNQGDSRKGSPLKRYVTNLPPEAEFISDDVRELFAQSSRKKKNEMKQVRKPAIHKNAPASKSDKQPKSFIHIGHDNWNLVLHMMLGVR